MVTAKGGKGAVGSIDSVDKLISDAYEGNEVENGILAFFPIDET